MLLSRGFSYRRFRLYEEEIRHRESDKKYKLVQNMLFRAGKPSKKSVQNESTLSAKEVTFSTTKNTFKNTATKSGHKSTSLDNKYRLGVIPVTDLSACWKKNDDSYISDCMNRIFNSKTTTNLSFKNTENRQNTSIRQLRATASSSTGFSGCKKKLKKQSKQKATESSTINLDQLSKNFEYPSYWYGLIKCGEAQRKLKEELEHITKRKHVLQALNEGEFNMKNKYYRDRNISGEQNLLKKKQNEQDILRKTLKGLIDLRKTRQLDENMRSTFPRGFKLAGNNNSNKSKNNGWERGEDVDETASELI